MLIWYVTGTVLAIVFACLAALIHLSGHAPVGIVSFGVGAALGAILSQLAATLQVAGRRGVLFGAVVVSLIAVLAQHAWLYAAFRREWHEGRKTSAHVAMFRDESPWSPRVYFSREATPQRIALWCVDAALIVSSACGTVWLIGGRERVKSASRPTLTP